MTDPPGKIILDHVRAMGYVLQCDMEDDVFCIIATHAVTREQFIARAPGDGFEAACLLAEMVGIDLEDG